MAYYRFKTKEEFIRDNRWDHNRQVPRDWCDTMKPKLGKKLPANISIFHGATSDFLYENWWHSRLDVLFFVNEERDPIFKPQPQSQSKFKEGDTVYINPNGKYPSQGRLNGEFVKGEIIAYSSESDSTLPYSVRWEGMGTNSYASRDLFTEEEKNAWIYLSTAKTVFIPNPIPPVPSDFDARVAMVTMSSSTVKDIRHTSRTLPPVLQDIKPNVIEPVHSVDIKLSTKKKNHYF